MPLMPTLAKIAVSAAMVADSNLQKSQSRIGAYANGQSNQDACLVLFESDEQIKRILHFARLATTYSGFKFLQ